MFLHLRSDMQGSLVGSKVYSFLPPSIRPHHSTRLSFNRMAPVLSRRRLFGRQKAGRSRGSKRLRNWWGFLEVMEPSLPCTQTTWPFLVRSERGCCYSGDIGHKSSIVPHQPHKGMYLLLYIGWGYSLMASTFFSCGINIPCRCRYCTLGTVSQSTWWYRSPPQTRKYEARSGRAGSRVYFGSTPQSISS